MNILSFIIISLLLPTKISANNDIDIYQKLLSLNEIERIYEIARVLFILLTLFLIMYQILYYLIMKIFIFIS